MLTHIHDLQDDAPYTRRRRRHKFPWIAFLATVLIRRATGAGPSYTDITSINTRLNTADAHSTNDTGSPIQIPASGTNYSYACWTQLDVTVAPTTAISNIRWYTDGSNSMGTGCGLNAKTTSTYVQATGTTGVTGDALGSTTNAFTYTSAAPLTVAGSIGNTTGILGDFVALQTTVGSTASSGATTSETMTFSYDES